MNDIYPCVQLGKTWIIENRAWLCSSYTISNSSIGGPIVHGLFTNLSYELSQQCTRVTTEEGRTKASLSPAYAAPKNGRAEARPRAPGSVDSMNSDSQSLGTDARSG